MFSFKGNISMDEYTVALRAEVLDGVLLNQKTVDILEKRAVQLGSLQWKNIDLFVMKCLNRKFPPGIMQLYLEDKKAIPGLDVQIINKSNLGDGSLTQNIIITLSKGILGEANIFTTFKDNKLVVKMEEVRIL